MMHKSSWLLILVFFWACNNDTKPGDASLKNAATGHDGHTMTHVSNDYCDSVNKGLITVDTLKGSPPRTALATVNGTDIHIEYNSPGVKGRIIWGGLVSYDKVWATGAHNATRLRFSQDVMFNDKKVPAGQYAFFTIPGKAKWVVILNTRYEQHLADEYNEKEDVIRAEVIPEDHELTQRLTYAINTIDSKSGEIVMQWEKILVRLPFMTQ